MKELVEAQDSTLNGFFGTLGPFVQQSPEEETLPPKSVSSSPEKPGPLGWRLDDELLKINGP